MSETPDLVALHYDDHPFPDPRSLVYPSDPDASRLTLEWHVGSLGTGPLDIWVAGCGTVQATEIALRYPDATVLATDVSAGTLEVSRRVAKNAGVAERIEFIQHDLCAPPPTDRSFHLIDCMGVLHHLADMDAALRHLRDALRPSGLLDLMIYQRAHREGFRRLRSAIAKLAGDAQPDLDLVRDVLTAVLDSGRISPALRTLATEMVEQHRYTPSWCADTLLHPGERAYELEDFVAISEAAGLAFNSFAYPHAWDPETWSLGPDVAARLARLPTVEAGAALSGLLGDAPPYLDLQFRRDDAPAREPISDEVFSAGRVRPHGSWRFARLDAEQNVENTGVWAPYAEDDGTIRLDHRHPGISVPAEVVGLLRSVGAGTTIEEIRRWEGTSEAVDDAIRLLLSPSVRLLLFEP